MVTETLELIIRTSGASSAGQQIGNIGAQARAATAGINSLNESLRFMRQTLVALSFIRVFEGIATSISQAQQINNQLIQIAKTAADVPKAFNMFSDIALATHAPLAAVTGLGVQIARSSSAYKMGAKDIADATQTIFNTFRLNGSDPATISNVTKDLKEIFSLGIVQGRQFRAVILQNQAEALLLAKYIRASGADAVNVNRELDALRAKGALPDIYETAMKHKGAFTGADVLRANIAATSDINDKVSQLPTTLGQSFTDLNTQWLKFLNSLNQSGAFQPIVNFVEFLAHNLPTIALGVMAIGAAFGSWMIIRQVAPVIAFLVTPIGIVTAALVGLGGIIALLFGEKLNAAVQKIGGWTEFLIRMFALFGAEIQTVFGNLGTTIAAVFFGAVNGVIAGVNYLTSKLDALLPKAMQIGQISQYANPYSAKLGTTFNEHLVANYKALEGVFGSKPKTDSTPELKPPAKPADNTEIIKDRANKMRDALQALEDMLARFAGPAVKFQADIDKIATKIKDWTTATHDAKGNVIPALLTNAAVAAKFAAAGFDDYNAKTHTSIKLQQDMAREVLGLKNTSLDFANTQTMVNKALEINAIDQAMANKLIEDAQRKRDLYNLSLLHTAEAGMRIAQIKFDQKKGGPDDIAERTATRALEFDQSGDLATYTTQTQVLGQMLQEHTISAQAYAASIYDIQRAYLSTTTDGIGGFQQGLLEVQHTMFDTAGDAARVLTDSFRGLQDALVTFATTGKLNVHNMAMSILTDLDTLIIKQAIMQPLIQGLGFGPGSSLGIGQANGGLGTTGAGGFLASLFGGSGAAGGIGQLGSSAATPMWVSIAPSTGDLFTKSASSLPGGGSSGGFGMFDQGGLMGKGGFFGNLFSGTGGGAGSASSGILDTLMSVGSLFGFATGGDFNVGGVGGTDSQIVAFRASPDERVSVQTPQQQRAAQKAQASGLDNGGIHVHLHGVQDFDSFKRSSGQLTAGIGSAVTRATRRNGH